MNKNFRKAELETELKRIVKTLLVEYSPEALILFGSLIGEKVGENSDIDLVIIKQTDKRFTERIGEVIEICKPKMAADFIVYTPEEFLTLKDREDFIKKEVIEKGKLIYERQ